MNLKNAAILFLIFNLICTSAFAIKMLRPGDIVKGKEVTETYFCYTAEEQQEMLTALKLKDEYINLDRAQRAEIAVASATIQELKVEVVYLTKLYNEYRALAEQLVKDKETMFKEQVKNRDTMRRNERKATLRGGLLVGAVAALFGRLR